MVIINTNIKYQIIYRIDGEPQYQKIDNLSAYEMMDISEYLNQIPTIKVIDVREQI